MPDMMKVCCVGHKCPTYSCGVTVCLTVEADLATHQTKRLIQNPPHLFQTGIKTRPSETIGFINCLEILAEELR